MKATAPNPTQRELLDQIASIRSAAHALAGGLEKHIVLLADNQNTQSQYDMPSEIRELMDANRAAQADMRKALISMAGIAARHAHVHVWPAAAAVEHVQV